LIFSIILLGFALPVLLFILATVLGLALLMPRSAKEADGGDAHFPGLVVAQGEPRKAVASTPGRQLRTARDRSRLISATPAGWAWTSWYRNAAIAPIMPAIQKTGSGGRAARIRLWSE